MTGEEWQLGLVGVLVGAALGVGGGWLLQQKAERKARALKAKAEQQRAQMDQANAQARKQIEQLQLDMARLRQRLAIGDEGVLATQSFEPTRPVGLEEPVIGVDDTPDVELPNDGFQQTRIVIQGHR